MKRCAQIILLTIVVLLACPVFGYCGSIKLVVDGKKLSTDTDPMMRSAAIFVPLRGVLEEFKSRVSFDKATNTVKAVRGKKTVVLVIDSTSAKVDGVKTIMPIPAFIYNNRTMVPLRFVSESLGCSVRWEPRTNTVYIHSKGGKEDDVDVDVKDIDPDIKDIK
jgi:hypothetical protein